MTPSWMPSVQGGKAMELVWPSTRCLVLQTYTVPFVVRALTSLPLWGEAVKSLPSVPREDRGLNKNRWQAWIGPQATPSLRELYWAFYSIIWLPTLNTPLLVSLRFFRLSNPSIHPSRFLVLSAGNIVTNKTSSQRSMGTGSTDRMGERNAHAYYKVWETP